jgi:CRP-like cAMP-binding protein
MNILSILDTTDFFGGVSVQSKEALADICIPKHLCKNEVLFSEGDDGNYLYFLVIGNIRVFKSAPGGKETVIKLIKPGEIFAEAILFELKHYPASAVALKTSFVYAMPKRQFHALLDDRAFRNDFIIMLMKKQRYLADQLHTLTVYDVEERFLRFLVEQYGKKDEYPISLSKKDIASAIGTIPETFSRLLARLHKEKLLTVAGKSIRFRQGFWNSRSKVFVE